MIRIQDQVVTVETCTLTAELRRGLLVSLRDRASGREWIEPFDPAPLSALELVYASGPGTGFGPAKPVAVTALAISDHCAEFRFHGWDADGVLRVSTCPASGALLLEPSAYSSRPGVRACRWNLAGIGPELTLVAPVYQGINLPLDDALIRNSHWSWPMHWEAGFAVLQGRGGGFWVHAQDTAYRYKALQVGRSDCAHCLGFDTEAYGPLDTVLGSGGLVWRLNVFQGDWQTPAGAYRDWWWRAYDLEPRLAQRQPWLRDLGFAVSWCHGDPDLLDALAEKVSPARTLIHFPNWRTDAYDENYPDFVPSAAAQAFIAKGKAMGFHILPHCNAVDMDPTHPTYAYLRDFGYRDLIDKGLLGWGWEAGKGVLSVPNGNASLAENRRRKVMVKIHPGLSMWRSLLTEHIQRGLDGLGLDGVFIDVTLCSFNIHNCLVENMTTTEGMRRLIDQVADIGLGLAVGGEGLNEITAQGLSVAQAHLFRSHHDSCPGLERAGGCPLNAFLFDRLCRTFGYSRLSGATEDERTRSRVHLALGAIPTITGPSVADIRRPNPAVQELFDRANA
jgi:hypothetical protein